MDKKPKVSSPLTNEGLSKKFRSNFELVNYAIKLAENMIKTGRGARVESEFQSRAMLILEEINAGKDFLDKNLDPSFSTHDFSFKEEDLKQPLIYDEKDDGRYRTIDAIEE